MTISKADKLKNDTESVFITNREWVRKRQREYFEINKSKYFTKYALILGYTGLVIYFVYITNYWVLLLELFYAHAVGKTIKLRSKWDFIEYNVLILNDDNITLYRNIGKTKKDTELIGPFVYSFADIDEFSIEQDRIVLKLLDSSELEYKLVTIQNNFNIPNIQSVIEGMIRKSIE